MSVFRGWWPGWTSTFLRALAVLVACLVAIAPAAAADKVSLIATSEQGFGRLLFTFPARMDLPAYKVNFENGVLAVEFEEPIEIALPDVAVALPGYITIARVDPDKRGIRFGLKTGFNVNRLEAGERLFVDLLPPNWQGLPPALPPSIVAELADRAKQAAIVAEQKRKALEAKTLMPSATLRIGRNPTFFRVQFDWTVDTEAKFAIVEGKGVVTFDWPVPVDLYVLKADLPAEVIGAENAVDANGSRVEVVLASPEIVPRFYQTSKRQFILDIDIEHEAGIAAAISAQEELKRQQEAVEAELAAAAAAAAVAAESEAESMMAAAPAEQTSIVPMVSMVGGTVRLSFPFEQDTAAAVFRRGDTVWMIFDTTTSIEAPDHSDTLAEIATGFEVIPAGATKVVRLNLARERLATLGSEGRAWVLSLGDVLLNATEPVTTHRVRDDEGHIEMTANLKRPFKVHEFRDPVVGDLLKVVTAFPPAQGVSRNLQYVDFSLLRSVHGLVIKPENEALEIALEAEQMVFTAPTGLTMSSQDTLRTLDSGNAPEYRASYIDFAALREDDFLKLEERREGLINKAAQSEGRLRDTARLDLAQFYVGNQLAYEAIGVLQVLEHDLESDEVRKKLQLTRGIADTLAGRSSEALAILNAEGFSDEVDALMWRSIAKADNTDYAGARSDAIAAESVVGAYPLWVRNRFLLSAMRSALETADHALALRYKGLIDFAKLEPEQVSEYQLFEGRIAEAEGRFDEALDAYGQVIAADIRPTRAEAVYRTLIVLDETGKIDLPKATETLSAEVLLWRGTALEADMQKLLAELYFKSKEYRRGFETVKQAVAYYPANNAISSVLETAQKVFAELYLDGRADELEPLEALSLYYDFRNLTPPGNRGDEMIRNLAQRLVKVDLLKQAADLLEYQIDSRLKGVAQAQVAADLAIVRIADRDPEGALRVLNRTRLADLSPRLERQRRILEARALIDADRQDLALDLLSRIEGREADMLRVEGYWKSKNYAVAAELLEVMYSPGANPEPLTQRTRMNIVKAGVGFVLAGDTLGLERLRSKFGEQLAQSPEWPLFNFVTSNISPTSIEFRKVAREVSGLDSLNAFLESYRQLYSTGGAMMPDEASPANEA